ncbi:PTS fructose transporter subunit IIB [Faecalicoccus pleomorphus]|uniref:PTS fructose transporter subunit IIB n=1 Tax=Faecalicoccus pleomorphus TaxID=1323 RepID=A0A7X9RK89_9FIRM|nr:fructose PTS transporter subunit IIB [Faecalicoccus pleomorphus]MBM6678922.1 PTS fructose transporter subunit IIB [Faecalicoccus pleomorphus]MBM6765496.1 PTS fructose transporter subunit IIB [Faecalicoccus pleomorphus]MBM6809302.1 PTS fructose transporter subunit IIB [Faecalicoccus pleomorphus]NME45251.1 PTS fructose transporter subunit IIB [Faecalicoccus pleomorphus]
MKIVGVAACTAGIAHTYIAKEKLVKAAKNRGHDIHIETQGTIGTEDALTDEEIKNADCAIIAADIKIAGKDRFKDLKMIEVPTEIVIKSPNKLIEKVEEIMAK